MSDIKSEQFYNSMILFHNNYTFKKRKIKCHISSCCIILIFILLNDYIFKSKKCF